MESDPAYFPGKIISTMPVDLSDLKNLLIAFLIGSCMGL